MSSVGTASAIFNRLVGALPHYARVFGLVAAMTASPHPANLAAAGEVDLAATQFAARQPVTPAAIPTGIADDRRDVPDVIYEQIKAKIIKQTTFLQLRDRRLVRWAPRSIELIEFVKVASPTYEDCYLYAMRYKTVVASEDASLDLQGTICAATVVIRAYLWTPPTVVCEPVDFSRTEPSS